MEHNCNNRPGWKKRALNCLFRTARAVIGVIIIAGIASMWIRYSQESKLTGKCEQLRMELEKLKNRQMESRRLEKSSRPEIDRPVQCSSANHDVSLPDREISDTVRKELSKYLADKTGMPDFALENLGGCVLTTRDTKDFGGGDNSIMNIFSKHETPSNRILRPDVTPGSCWAFEGSQGTVLIKLWSYVIITHVTLEHITPEMSPSGDILSAPKKFTLWGLTDPEGLIGKHKFGTFEYLKGTLPVQTFLVQFPVNTSYRVVEVTFHDNHGNERYTCVYRVRIHGQMDVEKGKLSRQPPS